MGCCRVGGWSRRRNGRRRDDQGQTQQQQIPLPGGLFVGHRAEIAEQGLPGPVIGGLIRARKVEQFQHPFLPLDGDVPQPEGMISRLEADIRRPQSEYQARPISQSLVQRQHLVAAIVDLRQHRELVEGKRGREQFQQIAPSQSLGWTPTLAGQGRRELLRGTQVLQIQGVIQPMPGIQACLRELPPGLLPPVRLRHFHDSFLRR